MKKVRFGKDSVNLVPVSKTNSKGPETIDLDTSDVRDVYRQPVCFSNAKYDNRYVIQKVLINNKEAFKNPKSSTIQVDPSKYGVKQGDSCTIRLIFLAGFEWSVVNCK
ncbi:MAG TPA: hypothetical protein VI112_11095 [Bacteroidia bacterium]